MFSGGASISRSPSRSRTSTRSPSTSSSSSIRAGCRKISRSTTMTASAAAISWSTSSAAVSDRSCSPSAGPAPGRSSSTMPPRVRADGFTTTGARRHGQRVGEAAHRAADQALADLRGLGVAVEHGVDTPRRSEQAQIESWALLRITSSQARSSRRPGPVGGGRNRAASGSASRSSVRSATAAACFTSTGSTPTPMSRLARAPDRSSPAQWGRPSVGAAATCSASERMTQLVRRPASSLASGHHPAQPGLGQSGGRCRSSRGRARRAGRPGC